MVGTFRICILITCFAFIFQGCLNQSLSSSQSDKASGGIAPTVLFKRTAPTVSFPSQVFTIRLSVKGSGIDSTADFPYSAHYAELAGIPIGPVTFTVEGLDVNGDVYCKSEQIVDVIENRVVTPVVTLVNLNPILLIYSSPKDGDTVSSPTVTISGVLFSENSLWALEIDGVKTSVTGDQWSKTVNLAEGNNRFSFFANVSEGTWNVSINIDSGLNEVTAIAEDIKGNKDTTSIFITYNPVIVDVTPPSIALLSHTDG